MGLLSNRVDRESLKPGDHVYSWRTASAYIYAHHGIYVGDDKVIHFTRHGQEVGTRKVLDFSSVRSLPVGSGQTCPTCSTPPEEGYGVVSSCLTCFLAGDPLYRFEYCVSTARHLIKRGGTCTTAVSDPDDVVIHRAKCLLDNGFGCYNVLTNNCENFAIYCKTGLVVEKPEIGHSGQAISFAAGHVPAMFCVPLGLYTANVCAIAVPYVAMYFKAKYSADVGRRKDVVKMLVEDLTKRQATTSVHDSVLQARLWKWLQVRKTKWKRGRSQLRRWQLKTPILQLEVRRNGRMIRKPNALRASLGKRWLMKSS